MKQLDVIKVERKDDELITCELITINDDLEDFYKHIGCSTIDIVERYFGGELFDVILDDEALLKESPGLPTSWWQKDGFTPNYEGLFGTLLLCHSDQEGNLTDATFEDVLKVHLSFRSVKTKDGKDLVILFHDIGG